TLNSSESLKQNPISAQKVYLDIAQWFLWKLQNVTSYGIFSELLDPVFHMAEMQLSFQMSQAEYSIYIGNEVGYLISSIQYPINGTEVSTISQSVIRILRENQELVKLNLAFQVTMGSLNQSLMNKVESLMSKDLPVLEGLIKLASSVQYPTVRLNSTDSLKQDPISAQKMYLEKAQSYLRNLQNVTSKSTFSEYLDPFLHMAEMQLDLQLSQADYLIFVNKEFKYLMSTIQYPINGTEVSTIGQSVIRILRENLNLLKLNLAFQVTMGNLNQSLMNKVETLISKDLPVLEDLVNLATSEQPLVYMINSTDLLMQDPIKEQKVYLQMAQWYLWKLDNVTSNSTFSELLQPVFHVAEMQLGLQLSQAEFSIFVSEEVKNLIKSIQYPVNAAVINEISQSVIKILNDNLDMLKLNFAYQEVLQNSFGKLNWFNNSFLNETETQIRNYLNLTQDWLSDPNVTQVLTKMLLWNMSGDIINMTAPGLDIQQLLQTLGHLLSPQQQFYLTAIQYNSQALNQVLMMASQEGGVGSDQFIQAIINAASSILNSFTVGMESVNITEEVQGGDLQVILQNALKLALRPNMNNVQFFNTTMELIRRSESVITRLVPQEAAGYLLPAFRFMRTYLKNILTSGTSDNWNDKIVQGSLNFLESVYENNYTDTVIQLLSSWRVPGNASIPALLENLFTILNNNFSRASNGISLEQFSANPQLPLSFVRKMLDALGLNPLETLWIQEEGAHPLNASSVMAIALEVAKDIQRLFTGLPIDNSSTVDLEGLEAQLMQWLSNAKENLMLPLSLRIGDTQVTYSGLLNDTSLAALRQLRHCLTNQTSSGITSNILRAVEQLKTLLDAPGGDPTPILLGYVIQLKTLLFSSLQLTRYEQFLSPEGNLTVAQVTELQLVVVDLLQFLSNSSLQQFSQAVPQATLQALQQRLSTLLPSQLQAQYLEMVGHFQGVIDSWASCSAEGYNCTDDITQVFQILKQVAEALPEASMDNLSIWGPANTSTPSQESINVTVNLLTLLYAWQDADISYNMSDVPKSVLKVGHFLQQIISTSNVSAPFLQQAMVDSNLTLGDLEMVAALAGAVNTSALLASVMGVINVQPCLQPQTNYFISQAQCAVKLSESITAFILALPLPPGSQSNYTELISLLPIFINHSVFISQAAGSDTGPLLSKIEGITTTIINITNNLNHLNLSSAELICNELHILESLIKLAASGNSPVRTLNSSESLKQNPISAQKVYLDIAQWFLWKLQNVTSYGIFSELLDPVFHMAEMQLSFQMSQAEYSIYIGNEVGYLISSIQYPINGTEVSTISQSVIRILRENQELVKLNLAFQVTMGNLNQSLMNNVESLMSKDLPVLEGLIKLASSVQYPTVMLNSTDSLKQDPISAQKMYLEKAQSYLRNLQNVTSKSTFSEYLDPFLHMAEMQLDLQLSQADYSIFVNKEVENFMSSIQYPINGTEVSTIGQSVIRILRENLDLLKLNLAFQVTMGNLNQSLMNKVETLISKDLPVLEDLINLATSEQPLVYMINSTDLLMQDPIKEQKVYLQMAQWYLWKLDNVTSNSTFSELLHPVFRVAEMQLGLQLSQAEFSIFVSEEVKNLIRSIQYPVNAAVINEISQSVIEILNDNLDMLKLNFAYQEALQNSFGKLNWFNNSFLNETETQIRNYLNLTQDWLSDPNVTQVLTNMLLWNMSGDIINMTAPGLDIQQLLQTLGHLLSPQQQFYLTAIQYNSQALNQMTDLLNSVLPLILGQILGQQGNVPFSLPSTEVFSDILPVLMSILTQQADQSSWDRLEEMLGAMLSTIQDTPVWDSVPPAVSEMRQVIETWVNNMQAETAFILSFQKPLAALMFELLQRVNSSNFNIAVMTERMPRAIQITVEVAIQASNGSKAFDCRQVMEAWEPVRAVAGLSEDSMGLWCNISLLPLIEAFAISDYATDSLNMTDTGNGTGSVDNSAAEIVVALRSLYWAQVNFSIATEQLGEVLSNTIFQIQELNLSTEDQAHWKAQFLQVQLSQSTQGLRMALEQLNELAVDNPWMGSCLRAVEMSLNYTRENGYLLQNSTSAKLVFMDAMEILMTGMNFREDLGMGLYLQAMEMAMNYTMDYSQSLQNHTYIQNLLFETMEILRTTNLTQNSLQSILTDMNFTPDLNLWMGLYLQSMEMNDTVQNQTYIHHILVETLEMVLNNTNLTQDSIQAILTGDIFFRPDRGMINKLLRDMARELVRVQMLGDWPMVYGVMEKLIEFSGWWSSTNATGMDMVTQTLPRIYEMVKAFISNGPEVFVELAENVIFMLRQISQTSDLFTPLDYYLSQLHEEMTGRGRSLFPHHQNDVSRRYSRSLIMEEPEREPMDDFLDLFYLNYTVLFQALAIPPTMQEIMDTAHMFFANPNLSVVLKGFSRDMMMLPTQQPLSSWNLSLAQSVTWGPTIHPSPLPLDDSVDVALGILSYLTLPSQWEVYGQLFNETVYEDWSMKDLADKWVENTVRKLGAEVTRIINSGSNNGSKLSIQFLTALNDILANNLEDVSGFTSQVEAIIQNVLSSFERPGAYPSQANYLMAINKSIGAFSSYLPMDTMMYLTTSGQMVKGFALLVANPWGTEKVLEAIDDISSSLDHFMAFVGETSLPDGRSVQSITYGLLLNSALSTQTLFNISTSSHVFNSTQEKEVTINQTFNDLLALLPEDQRMYVLPLEPPLLAALSGVSNTTQVHSDFQGISKQMTLSILTMLNLTNSQAGFQVANKSVMVPVLLEVSQQVANSLCQGLSTPPSDTLVPSLLFLEQAAMTLIPLLPEGSDQNFNISLSILHFITTAINHIATTRDIAGATQGFSGSIQNLLASLSSYPSLQTTSSLIADFEDTIQKMVQVLQSGQGPLAETARISQLLFRNARDLLGLANDTMENSLAQLLLNAAKTNMEHLLTVNETNWINKLSMILTGIANNFTTLLSNETMNASTTQNSSGQHRKKRGLGPQLNEFNILNASITTEQLNRLSLVLMDIANAVPKEFTYAPLIKNITMGLAQESQDNLYLMLRSVQLGSELFNSSWLDESFSNNLDQLKSKVCALGQMDSNKQLMQALSLDSGFLCQTFMPTLQSLHVMTRSIVQDNTDLYNALFETFIGDPNTYNINTNWTAGFTEMFGLNISSLKQLVINMTLPGVVRVSELLRNKTEFVLEVQRHTDIPLEIINLMMEASMPDSNLQILGWLPNMRHCKDPTSLEMNNTEQLLFKVFCNLPPTQLYNFGIIVARYIHVESVAFKLIMSSEMQGVVQVLLQMIKFLTDMMGKLLPAISSMKDNLLSVRDLNLVSDPEFSSMVQGNTRSISSRATFVTVSKAICNHGIMSLLGVSKLPVMTESDPSTQREHRIDELVDKFKIPRNATPFCMNFYLDMVNTTGGAIAWAYLKPMLLGQVLYSPDTPLTRAIIEKSNATLQQFASLKMYSEDWLQSSSYIMDSAKILTQTLPMLQNSLANSFVENFIEMQTGIDVGQMKDTLHNFSNMTILLEKNKNILNQITTLSNLMMNLSSCINFDRFRGINSTDELNSMAEHLTQTRDLYASIIFKLPEDDHHSSRKRRDASGSASSSLPPKVGYTIRMSIENSMRTDHIRNLFWFKDSNISPLRTQRYNRGFVYLQESIDRAIIETQTGKQVTEPAVQLQAFPYPCYLKDEYLNSISFTFPLVLMLAWILFIANFVKKLVHERELRLHEYMKMMGVNPISHFFAWFIESACFLLITIVLLTVILKAGRVLPNSDGVLLFLYLSNYGLSILAMSFLVSSFFDKTNIAGLSGSLIYIISFFPFMILMSMESSLSVSSKSFLSLLAPTCFSYAGQYITRYEIQGEGIQWSNQYTSPLAGDDSSFGWLCWLLLIDSLCYFIIGAYIRLVFPGKYGIAKPWYFPVMPSFWAELFCCRKTSVKVDRGLLFANILKSTISVFPNEKDVQDKGRFHAYMEEEDSGLPVGVALHGLTKNYGDRTAIENLNVKFYEGQVTTLLGHNGAGKTTTMSLLTGLFAPSAGSIEVYGKNMETNIDKVRQELGVCMQYDVHFDHLTTMEHLLLYGQIKAPHWSQRELQEQVFKILEETGMYPHRHKRVGALSGGMKRKLSISIAFIGGSRLVVLDEPTTGVDPCSRRSIWDIVIQHKRDRTIILSTHHLDEAEVLSDRIAFLEKGGLKCCGSPFYLKDKLAQGYNLSLTKKARDSQQRFDGADVKSFIQSFVPDARLKEGVTGDQVYSLPPFNSSNAEAYHSLLSSLDSNLDRLQLGSYGISDTTLEEVFLQLTQDDTESAEDEPYSVSGSMTDQSASRDSLPDDLQSKFSFSDKASLTGSSTVRGLHLAWQQITAMLIKRVHHSRRDWKGLLSQVVLPVLFVIIAMGLGSIRSDFQHFPEMELSPALYSVGPQYSFFSNQNANSSNLVNTMMSFPGIDSGCLNNPDNPDCTSNTKTGTWATNGDSSAPFETCKCTNTEQVCVNNQYQPPHAVNPSSKIVFNLTGVNVENYLVATANNFIQNRYGGFAFGAPLPASLQMDLLEVPLNQTLTKVWYNPEGYHTMPAYLNSLNNFILRTSLSADKDPQKYAISVSSHPYPGAVQEEDAIVRGVVHILVALCVLTGYSIMTASFALYEVQEHHTGSKRLQHISGIGEPFYWGINFLYDMALYMIPVILSIVTIAAFQLPAFTDKLNLAAVSLLLVMFGFATFPWMYLLSGIFKDPEMAFISYVCINLFVTMNTIIPSSIAYFLGQLKQNENFHEVYRILSYVFLIFPQFSFGNGLMQMARGEMQVQILSVYGIDAYKNPFAMDMLGWMFISLFLQGFVCFTLRLLLNKWLKRKVRNLIFPKKEVPETAPQDEDEDVVAEHQRVISGAAVTDLLQVNQLTKVYSNTLKKVPAVKRLSVGIPAGECFGLLGVNGAGKTTTFKMLTGDVSPSDGTAQIKNWDGRMVDIINCRNEGINIGYCPQVDALDELLTGEEHLYFYARIKGICKREMDQVVNYLLKKLELEYYRHNITDNYSCGTRRKLSTALALIGHPHILLLDEPSSGMDPRSKRHLWKIISEEVKGKCAVVLTSHSMEECEALCTRLAIMVKGQFRCLGSLQHIKNRFGRGFTVKMYLTVSSCDVEVITSFMQHHFPSTYLKDQHSSMVEYHVPVAPGGVADIFDQLESNKFTLHIKHFSVSQTTLDEVFINFAMGKVGMDTMAIQSGQGSETDSISLNSITASDT
ncbi:hypothetical protein UPYG_G00310290, partial [Umbra pygmaea]